MEIHDETLIFSTGKHRDVVLGVIGIDERLNVYEGFDGELVRQERPDLERQGYAEDYDKERGGTATGLTCAERIELAEYMIQLWTHFRDAQNTKEPA